MNAKGRQRSGSKKSRSRSKKKNPAAFWGDPSALPHRDSYDVSVADPTAVVVSLGRAPLPGHENASIAYLRLVTERASNLAVALAAAGGLDAPPAPAPEPAESADEADATEAVSE